jgi:hypothetical protein
MFIILMAGLDSPVHAQKLSPAEAADSVRNVTGGKVLKIQPPKSGSTDYRVKMLLPEGKVRSMIVDGDSGEIKQRSPVALKKQAPEGQP